MSVVTSLNFVGRTEAAVDFYREALDAEVLFLMRFRDCPDQSYTPEGMEDMIFHATFRIDDTEIMASDVGYINEDSKPDFTGFALALQLRSVERAKQVFNALVVGGQVVIPLAEAAFTDWYGIVLDRFGVSWKITVSRQQD